MNILNAFFIGLASSILSILFINSFDLFIFFLPGTIFGIFMGWYFIDKSVSGHKKKLILFAMAATFAHIVAIFTLGLGRPELHNPALTLPFVVAGGAGAFVFLLAFHFLIKNITIISFMILCFLGGFLALGWFVFPEGTFSAPIPNNPLYGLPNKENFIGVILLWQLGMSIGLGVAVKRRKNLSHLP